MKFSNAVVVITGGTAGIGRATARAFAEKGARIALIAREEDWREQDCSELREIGKNPLGISADVASAQSIEQAAARVEQELGWIHLNRKEL